MALRGSRLIVSQLINKHYQTVFQCYPEVKENTTNVLPMTALSVDSIPGGQITKVKLPEDDGSHLMLLSSGSNPATVSVPV